MRSFVDCPPPTSRLPPPINTRTNFGWICLLAALLLSESARAIEIPPEARVRNVGPRCVWASLETLGRARGIRPLQGLLARRCRVAGHGTDDAVNAQLSTLGVRYRNERHHTYNASTLAKHADSHGCVVSMKAGTNWISGRRLWTLHSIVLTGYDDKQVTFYCSDNPQLRFTRSRAWFDAGWAGNALVLMDEEETVE